MADNFWIKWQKNYLPTIALRSKWKEHGETLRVGDMVVIADERHPRGVWLKGRVEEVVLGEDKAVWSAKVRTKI